jgi:hypothetical protein
MVKASGGLYPNCSQICSKNVVGGQSAIINKSRLYHAFKRGRIPSEAKVSRKMAFHEDPTFT